MFWLSDGQLTNEFNDEFKVGIRKEGPWGYDYRMQSGIYESDEEIEHYSYAHIAMEEDVRAYVSKKGIKGFEYMPHIMRTIEDVDGLFATYEYAKSKETDDFKYNQDTMETIEDVDGLFLAHNHIKSPGKYIL